MPKSIIYVAEMAYGGWVRKEVAAFVAEAMLRGSVRPDIADVIIDPIEVFPVDVARNQAVAKANKLRADLCIMVDADCGPPPGWFDAVVTFLLDHHGPAFVICPYNAGDGNPMIFKHATNSTTLPPQDMDIRRMTREEVAHQRGFQPLGDGGCHLVAYRMDCFSMPPPWFSMTRSPDGLRLLAGEDSSCHQKIQMHGAKCYGSFDFFAQHWKEDDHGKPLVLRRQDVDDFYIEQAKAMIAIDNEAYMALRVPRDELEARTGNSSGQQEALREFQRKYPLAGVQRRREAGEQRGDVVQRLGEDEGDRKMFADDLPPMRIADGAMAHQEPPKEEANGES